MKVIDLFAGCGGLSLGFIKAGYTVEKAVEFDPPIAKTYKKNHPEVDVIVDDIKNIDMTASISQAAIRSTTQSLMMFYHLKKPTLAVWKNN